MRHTASFVLLLMVSLVAVSFGGVAQAQAECQAWLTTNDEHVAEGRAYTNTVTEGCDEVTTYYAVGSDDDLGISGSTTISLITQDGQTFHLGLCDDRDADGYDNDMDCAPDDATINPGASEICEDGIDQDCDGTDASCMIGTCREWVDAIYNHVSEGRAYAQEKSAGCDGQQIVYYAVGSDEDLGTSSNDEVSLYTDDGQTFYVGSCPDSDRDGFTEDVDCDDNVPSIHPGATEICGDGIDQDCDGSDQPCEEDNFNYCFEWATSNSAHETEDRAYVQKETIDGTEVNIYYAMGSDERLGEATITTRLFTQDGRTYGVGSCPDYDGDGYDDAVDCNDYSPSVHPDASEICGDGIDQDCSGSDLACTDTSCQVWRTTNEQHETQGRAYAITDGRGCDESTVYYAMGSDTYLGTGAASMTTLRTEDDGQTYLMGPCGQEDSAPAWQTPVMLSGEVDAQYFIADHQIVKDGQGNAVAVWMEHFNTQEFIPEETTAMGFIRARRYNGSNWEPPVLIEQFGKAAYSPKIAMSADGHAMILWQRNDADGKGSIMFTRLQDATWSAAEPIPALSAPGATPHIAMDAQGNAMVVWHQQYQEDLTQSILWTARFDGSKWSTPELLITLPYENWANWAEEPQLVMNAGGKAVFMYKQVHRDSGDSAIQAIFFDGSAWQASANVMPYVPSTSAKFIKVGIDDNGNAISVWRQLATSTDDGMSLLVRRFDGTAWGTAEVLADNYEGKEGLAVSANGTAMAYYAQNDHLRVRHFNGADWDPALLATPYWSVSLSIQSAMDAEGRAMLILAASDIWSYGFDGSTWGTSRLASDDSSGGPQSGTQLSKAPQLTMDANGNAAVVWRHNNVLWVNRFE